MKKIIAMVFSAMLPFMFFSCGGNSDDSNEETKVPEAKPVSTKVETVTLEEGKKFSEEVTLDLSSNPLTDEAVAAIESKETDISEYFRQSRLESGRYVFGADDKGLDNFEVKLVSVTNVKIVVTITATAPSMNCTVLITAAIPAEATENHKAYVSLVKQVSVGEVSEISDATFDSSKFTVPSADEVDGLILTGKDDDGDTIWYKFEKASDGKITVKEYKQKSYDYSVREEESYSYDVKTGELKAVESSDDSDDIEMDIGFDFDSLAGGLHLIKSDDDYYIYEMKLPRTSGEGLDSTFSMPIYLKDDITVKDEKAGSFTVKGSFVFTTTSKGTLTGVAEYEYKSSYSKEFIEEMKKAMEAFMSLVPEEEGKEYEASMAMYSDVTVTGRMDITGVYTNDGGLITVNGKQVSTMTQPDCDQESGKMEYKTVTEVEDFNDGAALYDGNNLYLAEKYTKTDEIPESSRY